MIKEDLINRFFDDVSECSIIFEDNGRVAYAYLLDSDEDIIGDVWLYNRCPAPIEPEWKNPENQPFANPAKYIANKDFHPVSDISEVSVSWVRDSNKLQAHLYIRDILFAVLEPELKPGWSFLAEIDSPLAKSWNSLKIGLYS
jgi:hypothetical protein